MTAIVKSLRLAVAALALVAAGCADSPTAPRSGCVAVQRFSDAAVAHLTENWLRGALADAAERNAPIVFGAEAAELQSHLAMLTDELATPSEAATCRAIDRARARLDAAPDDPALQPDRAVLMLLLDMTESFLAK